MAKVLSTSSQLRTGLYKTSTSLFFTPSKLFVAQMTELFDEVWPMVTALKMLRWQVKGYYEEYCIESNGRLSQKFVEKEDVTNRPNLYRTCIEESWESTEYRIAKNLLINVFACYEGWVSSILKLFVLESSKSKPSFSKCLEYRVKDRQKLLSTEIRGGNSKLIKAFYDVYKNKSKHYNPSFLDNWFFYYNYFKQCRNTIIHNGGQTRQEVIDAYIQIQHLTEKDLDVLELPQSFPAKLNEPIRLSLRGVVGFSQLVIKIVSTMDVELIRAENADKYFASRILEEVKGPQTLSSDDSKKWKQVCSLVSKGRFQKPSDVRLAYEVLKTTRVVF